jgi:uncharacterized protein YjiS (DUF1127 family)
MFKKFVENFMAYQKARTDYWMLESMTDKQLKDIGITRGEIREKVYS